MRAPERRPRPLSVKQFAESLGMPASYVYREIRRGRLKVRRVHGLIKISHRAIDKWMTLGSCPFPF